MAMKPQGGTPKMMKMSMGTKVPVMKAVNNKAKMHSDVSMKTGKGATSVPGERYHCGTSKYGKSM